MYSLVTQIAQHVFVVTTDTQDIHIKLIAEATFLHRLINQLGRRHQYDFGNTNIVKVECLSILCHFFR